MRCSVTNPSFTASSAADATHFSIKSSLGRKYYRSRGAERQCKSCIIDIDAAHEHHELGWWRKYIFSTDHKVIGIQYGLCGLAFLFLGFCLMMLMRWQLAYPGQALPVIGKWLPHIFGPGSLPDG